MRHFLLLGFIFSIFASEVWAGATQTRCYFPSCAEAGWESLRPMLKDKYGNPITWDRVTAKCLNSNCRDEGYNLEGTSGISTEIRCNGSCEKQGWTSKTIFIGGSIRTGQTVCFPEGCFVEGYITTYSEGSVITTKCKKNDCDQFGWVMWTEGKPLNFTTCWSGGCLKDGYTTI
jgi:hypothetical protein